MINKRVVLAVFFSIMALRVSAQELTVSCGSNQIPVRVFRQTGWNTLDNQFAVKYKILSPITDSENDTEIRIYNYGFGAGDVTVIICNKDYVKASRYFWVVNRSKSKFVSPNPLKINYQVFKHNLKINNNSSWQSLIKALVDNHICDIAGQDLMNIEVLKKNSSTQIAPADGGGETIYEIKVKDRFRAASYYNGYDPEPLDNIDYQNLLKITAILQRLESDRSPAILVR